MARLQVCCAGLVVCFLLAADVSAGAQHSKKHSKSRFQIVFDNRVNPMQPKQRLQDIDVYVMDQYGEHVRRLTSNHKSHSPAWSPDGKQIAYLDDDESIAPNPGVSGLKQFERDQLRPQMLFQMDAAAGNAVRIASLGADVRDVSWLPDGEHLALRHSDRSNLSVYFSHGPEFDAPIDGTDTVRDLLHRARPFPLFAVAELFPVTDNFLPSLYVHSGVKGVVSVPQLYELHSRMTFQPDASSFVDETTLAGVPIRAPVTAYDAAWSPDGKRIAYSRFPDGKNSALSVADLDGDHTMNERTLTSPELEAHNPAWSADGRRLAFEGRWKDTQQIYVVNADGSDLMQLSREAPMSCSHPSWAPDGNWIVAECKAESVYSTFLVYELLGWHSDIYLFNVNKPKATPAVLFDCSGLHALPHAGGGICGAHNPSFAPVAEAR